MIQSDMRGMVNKNSVRPSFCLLADIAIPEDRGVFTQILPTIALTTVSGKEERKLLAERFHIDTIVTSHVPGDVNMSQGTGLNESIVVMRRHERERERERFRLG